MGGLPINHGILLSKLRAVVGNGNALTLIASAIRNSAEKDLWSFVGVPQGLSISNVLANIYFLDEDSVFEGAIFWRRYVDDMLLISEMNEASDLLQSVRNKLKSNLRLDSHQTTGDSGGKTTIQPVETGVGFLGFHISRARVSVKKNSIEKLMSSLVNILTSFSHRGGEERLIWKLNLRITGCIYDGKPIGWIFFFRQMDDLSQLHRLDHFLYKELQRFNLHGITARVKTFIKAYREVRFNPGSSTYVPDFDNFSLADMVNTISLLTNRPLDQVAQMQRNEIEVEFFRLIKKEAFLLERETVNFIVS